MLSHRSFWLMIVCSVLIIPLISSADNSMKDPDRFPAEKSAMKADYVPGEIIIKFRQAAKPADRDAILSDLGASTKREFPRLGASCQRITGMTVEEAIRQYSGHPDIAYIEPNYIVELHEIPNDPLFSEQWALLNVGQLGGQPGADISARQAWDVNTTSGDVVVAIIDTGVDIDHPDLTDNMYHNNGEIPDNGIDDDSNGYVDDVCGWDALENDNTPEDEEGHGTTISGIIGAVGDNAMGVSGVSWNVQILPVRWARYMSGPMDALVAGVLYALALNVDIMNCSFGSQADSEILRAAFAATDSAGILAICSAGNLGQNVDVDVPNYPASYEFATITSVAATDYNDELAWWSNWGPESIDLAAPGVRIYSTLPGGGYGLYVGIGSYGSGTSFAAPFVAGTLALMMGKDPWLSPAEAKERLLNSVDYLPSLAGKVVSEGRVNAFLALAEPDSVAPDAVSDIAISITENTWVELTWTASGDDGSIGTASEYDIRYATSPIDEYNFDSAIAFANTLNPAVAGTPESLVVDGLEMNTTYYFALKVMDEWGSYGEPGNISSISNVVFATTLGPPDISVDPTSLQATVAKGDTALRYVTIENGGAGGLDFAIAPQQACEWLTVEPETGHVPAGEDLEVEVTIHGLIYLECGLHQAVLEVETNDPVNPVIEVSVESEFIGPPDIETRAASVDVGPVPIDSTFTKAYTVVNAGCEDLISSQLLIIVPKGSPYSFSVLPSSFTISPGDTIDLTIGFTPEAECSATGILYIYTNDPVQPQFSVTLVGQGVLPPEIGVTPLSVATELYTGGIAEETVVISNSGGYQLAFTIDLVDPGDTWIWANPNNGTVPPGEELEVTVGMTAAGKCSGLYSGELEIASTDPNTGSVIVGVEMDVTSAPHIVASPDPLEFTTDPVMILSVGNEGCDYTLEVSNILSSNPVFSVSTTSLSVPVGQNRRVNVSFQAPEPGVYNGVITIFSNDPDNPEETVAVHAELIGKGGSGEKEPSQETIDFAKIGVDLKNAPNPFNPTTEFQFNLPHDGLVEIRLFDMRGRLVQRIEGGQRSAGPNTLYWNGMALAGTRAASGVYLYRLYLDGSILGSAKRMSLIK